MSLIICAIRIILSHATLTCNSLLCQTHSRTRSQQKLPLEKKSGKTWYRSNAEFNVTRSDSSGWENPEFRLGIYMKCDCPDFELRSPEPRRPMGYKINSSMLPCFTTTMYHNIDVIGLQCRAYLEYHLLTKQKRAVCCH